ncbi:hypothetical protein [Flavobacterium sp.]|uniref:hypothetical protein n=1 Tax=Flavobacterium sp. TaxID=239 RepID=UPI002629B960|nr:hypothetical protein [Flavobacterium sp.]
MQQQSADTNQEIELNQIKEKLNQGASNFSYSIYKGIMYLKRKWIALSVVFVLCLSGGLFLDSLPGKYNHLVIVMPNFMSTDYLYQKTELFNSKIKENDTAFFAKLGVARKKLKNISMEPITDVYQFVKYNSDNFEMLKLISENNDIEKVLKDEVTAKNYPYHLITITTAGKISKNQVIEPLMLEYENSAYFKAIQKLAIQNNETKIVENTQTLNQVNNILNAFGKGSTSASAVYINENSQINEILLSKSALITEQGNRQIERLTNDKIAKVVSITPNIKSKSSLNGSYFLVLPLVGIIGFLLFGLLSAFLAKNKARFLAERK